MKFPSVFLILFLTYVSSSLSARDFNILDYGAKSDTTVLSTKAVQQAIDDCSAAGGGRVVVPIGKVLKELIIVIQIYN